MVVKEAFRADSSEGGRQIIKASEVVEMLLFHQLLVLGECGSKLYLRYRKQFTR